MLEVDIPIPAHQNVESIPAIVEQVCAQIGLDLSSKGTLAKYPGCIHWHYKKGKARGTLEITWWAADRRNPRLWLKVAAGRSGDWINPAIASFREQFEQYNNSQRTKFPGDPS